MSANRQCEWITPWDEGTRAGRWLSPHRTLAEQVQDVLADAHRPPAPPVGTSEGETP